MDEYDGTGAKHGKTEMQVVFARRRSAEKAKEKKQAAMEVAVEEKTLTRNAGGEETWATTEMAEPSEMGPLPQPTAVPQSPEELEDQILLWQRKRKTMAAPESILVSDTEEGVPTVRKTTGP